MTASLTLTISHHIWLTRQQRYDLQDGRDVEAVGTYTPVWFFKGSTSEPARELFAFYSLTTTAHQVLLDNQPGGFRVNIPAKAVPPQVPASLWFSMTEEDREVYFRLNGRPPTADSLKDFRDRGSEWCFFRYVQQVQRHDKKLITIVHCVEIKDLATLTETLV